MIIRSFQFLLIAAATAVAPLALHAQTDPNGMPGGPTSPMPGQTAGSSSPGTNSQSTPGVLRPGALSRDLSQPGSGGADAGAMRDRIFLRKAAAGGLAEVQLGQLAVQKGSTEDVRSFAQKMVTDHTQLNSRLKPFADTLGVVVSKPDKTDQAEFDKLSSLSGPDFDREYLTFEMQDHHKDLREFRMEAINTSDPDLKDAVSHGQTVIAEHTRMVDKLAAANGISRH